jgi:hypothetical protein
MGDVGPAMRCFTAPCDFPQNQQMRSEERDQDLSIRTFDSTGVNPSDMASFAELLIDCEEDRTLRTVLVGMLREGEGR